MPVHWLVPYNWQMVCDLEWFPLVTRHEIRSAWLLHPNIHVSTAMEIHDQPTSKHLASLELCLHTSAASTMCHKDFEFCDKGCMLNIGSPISKGCRGGETEILFHLSQ